MIQSLENQTIALCGLFLAADLVQSIADSGQCDETDMRTSLESLFSLDADSVESIYGSKSKLKTGQHKLVEQLAGTSRAPNLQKTHYVLNLIKLEAKCNATSMQRIRRGIENAQQLRTHYDTLDSEIISPLAKIYVDNISNLSPRIVVHGNREYLEQEEHANRIRACLLAGIRSAVLWRQSGGTRWKIVAGRQKFVNQAKLDLETS